MSTNCFCAGSGKRSSISEGSSATLPPPDARLAPPVGLLALVVDPRDYENERADDARGSLLDLLDDWGLERAEGDDVVVTSRTYSVYDAEYPGFDGENMEQA